MNFNTNMNFDFTQGFEGPSLFNMDDLDKPVSYTFDTPLLLPSFETPSLMDSTPLFTQYEQPLPQVDSFASLVQSEPVSQVKIQPAQPSMEVPEPSLPETGTDIESISDATVKHCKLCDVDHSKMQAALGVGFHKLKSGRPVADRSLSDEELLKVFQNKLRTAFTKIEAKFAKDASRTDKYRTMLVRACRRVLSEAMTMIGVDSYSKSTQVNKFLPEFEKRFAQMKRLVGRQREINNSQTWQSIPSLDS